MCDDLVFSIQECIKLVPGLVLFPISLYFAWKKIGTKVLASISTTHEWTTAPRIGSVVLQNFKDKPLTVFCIYAVVNNDVYFEVEHFDPPLIIKPLETTRIETQPYSQLILGTENFEPDFHSDEVAIYLVTEKKVIECKMVAHPTLKEISGQYRRAQKGTNTFNNIVYNDHAAFAVVYRVNSDVKTAIVDRAGFVRRNWDFGFNMVPKEHMNNENDLSRFLESAGLNKAAAWFKVYKLEL